MFEGNLIFINFFNSNYFPELTFDEVRFIPFLNFGNIVLGAFFVILLMNHILKSAEMDYKIQIWKFLIVSPFVIILTYFSMFEIELVKLDGFGVFIIKPTLVSFTLALICVVLIVIILLPKYIKFARVIEKKKSGRKRTLFYFTFAIVSSILLYISCVILRIHFGNNWGFIIFIDIFMMIAVGLSLIASLFYGFGEEMSCIINIEELYIAHSSGKLIHVEKFIERESTKESLLTAFFMAANMMVQEIRSEGSGIERFVLDDGSEIILSFGKYVRGILIVNKYNKLFKDKLDSLIRKLEELPNTKLENWTFGTLDFSQSIKKLLKRIF